MDQVGRVGIVEAPVSWTSAVLEKADGSQDFFFDIAKEIPQAGSQKENEQYEKSIFETESQIETDHETEWCQVWEIIDRLNDLACQFLNLVLESVDSYAQKNSSTWKQEKKCYDDIKNQLEF